MPEYREGPEARENFEQAMRAAFQSPKPKPKKQKTKPATFRKTNRSDKD
jgi:hypothetical protein